MKEKRGIAIYYETAKDGKESKLTIYKDYMYRYEQMPVVYTGEDADLMLDIFKDNGNEVIRTVFVDGNEVK